MSHGISQHSCKMPRRASSLCPRATGPEEFPRGWFSSPGHRNDCILVKECTAWLTSKDGELWLWLIPHIHTSTREGQYCSTALHFIRNFPIYALSHEAFRFAVLAIVIPSMTDGRAFFVNWRYITRKQRTDRRESVQVDGKAFKVFAHARTSAFAPLLF